MTILIDRASASRLAKHLRRTAGLPTHSKATQAVARALDFSDDNALSAALRNNGVVTLVVPYLRDKVTSAFLKSHTPSPASAAEMERRMFLSTGLSPKAVPYCENDDEAMGACFIATMLGSAHAWFGCSVILPNRTPQRMHMLTEDILQRFEQAASRKISFNIPEMAERAGVTASSLGEALSLELSYEIDIPDEDSDEDKDVSTPPKFTHFLACRMASQMENLDMGGWDTAVPLMLRSFIEVVLVNDHPIFGKHLPLLIREDDGNVEVQAYALRGGIGEPFRFHAVYQGMEIPRLNDDERNAHSPFNIMIMR